MSSLRLLPALLLAVVSSAWASDPSVPPELRGILVTGQDHRFALVGSGGGYSRWASLGDTVEGWKLVDYISTDDAIVLSRDSQKVTVRLCTATVGEAGANSGVQTATATADEVLHKMKFEAMWDRIFAEQKKAIVGGMRQQASAEFAKLGLPQDEIDTLLDKMGDAVVVGLQPDAMRQDFARIFTEVYTKDELRGMADFYDTAAGKAWAEKQPEVQQKLMQSMMPRVMQGMPAAQKVAADYLRQRAAAAKAAEGK
jgi:uncharacterized protein